MTTPDPARLDPTRLEPTRFDPAAMAWNRVATYTDYADAQGAVDYLSDKEFPVEHLDIVGSGLHLVERVTGRMTRGRAAAAGAAGGAWIGLLFGILVGLFTFGPVWIGLVVGGLVAGAIGGAILGYIEHAATRGRRDFSSVRTLQADRYDVIAGGGQAERARSMLTQAGHVTAG